MEKQTTDLLYSLCDQFQLPYPKIVLDYAMKYTGVFEEHTNTIKFNPSNLHFSVARTIRHEFRHYWQKANPDKDWMTPWNIVQGTVKRIAVERGIHLLEEDAKFFAEHPNLEAGIKILDIASPQEVRQACLVGVGIPVLRRHIADVVQEILESADSNEEQTSQG